MVLQNLTSKTIHLTPGRCMVRIATANEVPEAGAGQGVGGNPSKGGPLAYHGRVTETPYGVAMTGWMTGTNEGVAARTGPEI